MDQPLQTHIWPSLTFLARCGLWELWSTSTCVSCLFWVVLCCSVCLIECAWLSRSNGSAVRYDSIIYILSAEFAGFVCVFGIYKQQLQYARAVKLNRIIMSCVLCSLQSSFVVHTFIEFALACFATNPVSWWLSLIGNIWCWIGIICVELNCSGVSVLYSFWFDFYAYRLVVD